MATEPHGKEAEALGVHYPALTATSLGQLVPGVVRRDAAQVMGFGKGHGQDSLR